MAEITAKLDRKAGTFTVVLPVEPDGTMSSSGKSEIIASTRGNQNINVVGMKEPVSIGVNAYQRR